MQQEKKIHNKDILKSNFNYLQLITMNRLLTYSVSRLLWFNFQNKNHQED